VCSSLGQLAYSTLTPFNCYSGAGMGQIHTRGLFAVEMPQAVRQAHGRIYPRTRRDLSFVLRV
jgi:hypothetical protein